MANNEIINYIKSELAGGEKEEQIMRSLVNAGWKSNDIQEAFNAISKPMSSSVIPFQSTNENKTVTEIITEKNYPITTLWVFKTPIILILLSIILFLFGYWNLYLVIAIPTLLIVNPLTRSNFHYSTEEKFLIIKQGILSKKQRSLPYGVIQNVFIKQDVFDRIFGLASLAIENASMGGRNSLYAQPQKFFGMTITGSQTGQQGESVGSSGNKVNIPGLKKQDAEALKAVILQKMKENPIEDSQSGL